MSRCPCHLVRVRCAARANDALLALARKKPLDLPDKTHGKSPPLPESATKDHLDVFRGGAAGEPPLALGPAGGDGLIRPFHSFLLALTMILFSEVGDKTFLVAALMAMKHDRMVVFSAALSALITMTVLSASTLR